MKKLLALTLAGTMLLGSSMVYAGGACCSGKADSAKVDKAMGCGSDVLAKLNLNDDQKKKIDALKSECKKDGCTPEMRDKFSKSMKEILTADQYTLWQSECQKVSKGSCPYMKKDEPKS